MPLPLPLPLPRESTTDVLFRTSKNVENAPSIVNDRGDTGDDSESLWKAGGVPSHSMSMSKARKDRLSKQEQGAAVDTSVTAAAAAAEIYKHGNDGSMLWSAPTSIAGSIGENSTLGDTAMDYNNYSNRTTPLASSLPPPALPPPGLQIHQVQDMMDEKIHNMMEWCTQHFDGMSTKLGVHLHRIVSDSLMNNMKEMISNSHRTLLLHVKQEITKQLSSSTRNAQEDPTAMARRKDTMSENHMLKMEIQRREIKSRARKLIQPDPAAWQLKTLSEVEPLLEVVGNTSSHTSRTKEKRLMTQMRKIRVNHC